MAPTLDSLDTLEDEIIDPTGQERPLDGAPIVHQVDESEPALSFTVSEGDADEQAVTYLKEQGSKAWLKRYAPNEDTPIPSLLALLGVIVPSDTPQDVGFRLFRGLLSRLRTNRSKLVQHNTVDDAIRLIRKSKRIMVLTGAGISVSCGIPDFRSPEGLYAKLQNEGKYDLDDPQQMFDIDYFRVYPEVFYSFASQIYPSNFVPSPCHRFVKVLEDRGKLLRNYTQNIDTLETLTGVKRVLQCHGSFATASCIVCRRTVPGSDIKDNIFAHTVPFCIPCSQAGAREKEYKNNNKGKGKGKGKRKIDGWNSDDDDGADDDGAPRHIMKPDITFFGEKLANEFDKLFAEDRSKVDLLLVIGTSLKVAPVADIVYRVPHSIPQILINKTPVMHAQPDIVLLGDADDIIQYICHRLRWDLPPPPNNASANGISVTDVGPDPTRLGKSHYWAFRGAEPGGILEKMEAAGSVNGLKRRPSSRSSSLSSLSSLSSDLSELDDIGGDVGTIAVPANGAPQPGDAEERRAKRARYG